MQNLKLTRPLVAFDLETTGTDVANDRIVQIALVRVEPLGTRRSFVSLVDPQRPIPEEASAVHGIRDEDVQGAPTLDRIAGEIAQMLHDADLAGFNSVSFDLPLLSCEMERVGQPLDLSSTRHVDAFTIFRRMEPRTLSAAVRFYCGREMDNAHDALADVEATIDVIDAQVAHYDDLPSDVLGLDEFCAEGQRFVDATRKFAWNDRGEAVIAFGKHKGTSLAEIAARNPDYLTWMVGSDFSGEVKRIANDALAGRFPQRRRAPSEKAPR